MSRSLDLPETEGVDALAQELAKLQDNGKRRIAFLGSRHVPVVDIHLIELIARSLACLLYTSPSPRDLSTSRMPSSA